MKKLFNLLTAVVIIHSALYFSGCNSYQKQLAGYHAFSYQHPDELAKDCAKSFPLKDSLVKGTETFTVDTASTFLIGAVKLDTIGEASVIHDTLKLTITKNHYHRDTIFREDKAKLDTLYGFIKNQSLQIARAKQLQEDTLADRDKYKKHSETRLFVIITLSILLLGLISFNIYRFFSGGLVKKFI